MANFDINKYENPKNELLSDFNEAKFQIFRLHNEYTNCNRLSSAGDLTKWCWHLDIIWRELSSDAIKKEGTIENNQYFKEIDKLNKDINNFSEEIEQNIKKGKKIEATKSRSKLYRAIEKKEIYLRNLQDDFGKGSKRSSEDEDDIDS